MDLFLDILLALLIISATALCIYLIITLRQVTKTLSTVQEDVHQIKNKIDPILENVNTISDKVAKVTEEGERLVNSIKEVIEDIKFKFDNLLNKSKHIKETIENPVADLYKRLSAISHGVSAFWNTLFKK